MGADEAAKFFLTATATAFGGFEGMGDALEEAMRDMMEPELKVYRLKISITNSPTRIERVVDVPDCTLGYLHEVIQDAFDWTNSHLHVFEEGDQSFGPVFEDGGIPADWADEDSYLLSDLIGTASKKKLSYTYDFGDDWVHKIELVSKSEIDKRPVCAVCISGYGAGPPEDCGGVYGYGEILERLENNKLSDEDWLPPNFDPTHFDLKKTNAALKRLKWSDFH
jgi:hypothetical protein